MGAVRQWFHERVPISTAQLQELTNEPVPNHLKRWWFCLGGTPAYLFVVQIFTGILLAFYYQPAPRTAYESVGRITNEVAFGWYFRSVHKWAATLMIAAVILHQMRVYFTGAYRKPYASAHGCAGDDTTMLAKTKRSPDIRTPAW